MSRMLYDVTAGADHKKLNSKHIASVSKRWSRDMKLLHAPPPRVSCPSSHSPPRPQPWGSWATIPEVLLSSKDIERTRAWQRSQSARDSAAGAEGDGDAGIGCSEGALLEGGVGRGQESLKARVCMSRQWLLVPHSHHFCSLQPSFVCIV